MGPETQFTLTIGTLLALGGIVWRSSAKFSELSTKVDVIWDHLIRRGQAEGIHAGAMARNSPLVLTDDGRAWFAGPLGDDIRKWYQSTGKKFTDRDLYAALEKEFGERIAREVSVPRAVHSGACLAAAVLICHESDPK